MNIVFDKGCGRLMDTEALNIILVLILFSLIYLQRKQIRNLKKENSILRDKIKRLRKNKRL
ncbi:hypothetical protein B8A46_05015 [Dolosigranulum pigrum]|nr:hypothetical protein B8A31_04145 [Dolosigranulum pigrum]RAN59946.1 hypothetical protein B8A46_05015 [Dolosigranulum pigrum]